uniref:NADH:ubiquinone reductase (H(+)-translocating) n=1 Tax=Azygia robusta TaxID=3062496 RepID=A0AA50ZML7_9TREM|nr:NADH dehydrogenase subunit 5 [Azygia robusta]WMH04206.1 NADH dehydrogenase subunit 5 [Azygia robusta]
MAFGYFVVGGALSVLFFGLVWGVGVEVLFGLCGYDASVMAVSVVFESYSLLCLMMLFICSAIVLPFVFHYMGGYRGGVILYLLILVFIFVMAGLMVSNNILATLLGWEYLGLVSYLLILFLGTLSSVRASLVTLVASRFGDVSLFVVLCLFGGFYNEMGGLWFSVCVLLVVLTKSACFPFTSWLLEAMRAPTPVSCLVHSSTLVAAGVWFCVRYGNLFSGGVKAVLLLCAVLTIILTALSALYFVDLKKLVALSTCNNISWCLLCYCLGDTFLCTMFLVTHGVSKCLLFMSVGDLMSSSGGSQGSKGVYLCRYTGVYSCLVHLVLLCSLCGLPFMGVFITKHVLASYSASAGSGFLYFLVCSGVVLSFAYSYRFAFLLLDLVGGLSLGILCGFSIYGFMGVVPLVINYVGSYCLCGFEESVSVFWGVVFLFFYIHLLGFLVGAVFYLYAFRGLGLWGFIVGGCEVFVGLMYSLYAILCDLCYFSFYRWEVGVTEGLSKWFEVWGRSICFLITLGCVLVGVLWSVGLLYLLWF